MIKKGLITLICLTWIASCPLSGQDRNTITPAPLPFQQQAPTLTEEQLAIQFYQSRDYQKAVDLFEKIYDKKPSSYYYTYYLYSLVELKEYDQAEKLVKNQRKQDPENPKFLVDIGYILFRSGSVDKAQRSYDEAIRMLKPEQQQINDLANTFILRGVSEYAIKVYKKGRELLDNSYTFSYELASVYERMGDYRSTIDEYLFMAELNESNMKTVEDKLQNMLSNDPENEKNEYLRTTLLTRVQKNPEMQCYSELLWWYAVQQRDFEMALIQAKSLDRRLRENGERLAQLAQVAVSNEEYTVAIDAYTYVLAKGRSSPLYDYSRMELLNTRFLQLADEPDPDPARINDLEKQFELELGTMGESAQTLPLIRNLARLEAFYKDEIDDAYDLLSRAIELKDLDPQRKADVKLDLGDILLYSGDVWEATLLYQQVYKDFKNDVIGQLAKFKNAKLSFYIGEFKWAQAQADVLKAATSKLISNDAIALSLLVGENYDPDSGTVALSMYAHADLLAYKNKKEEALLVLDSIQEMFYTHAILDDVLLRKGDLLQDLGRFEEADSMYRMVYEEYADDILADEALMRSAALHERRLNDKQGAMERYQSLMERYPGSVFVVDARQRFRSLRGDSIQ